MKMLEVWGYLGDAAVALILLVMLIIGVPVEWIVGILLGLEVFSKLCRAFTSFSMPTLEALRAHTVVTRR